MNVAHHSKSAYQSRWSYVKISRKEIAKVCERGLIIDSVYKLIMNQIVGPNSLKTPSYLKESS